MKTTTAKRAARAKKSGTAVRTATAERTQGNGTEPTLDLVATDEKLDGLVRAVGNNKVAELLQVSRSQPSRWRTGKEGIGPESARKVLDLEYVLSRLAQLYAPDVAEIWLRSFNAHLGARPIDVLKLRGAGPVVGAIDAEAEGAFA
jgi:hypothetical protein